jgi:phosphate transport system permease protein
MRSGGILPAIIGTLYLTIGTAIFSVPLGIAAAIYLSEYAKDNQTTRLIRLAIINLGGHPFGGVRLVRAGIIRPVPAIWDVHPRRFADSLYHDPARHHQHRRRIPALRAAILPHSEHLTRRHPLADHPPHRLKEALPGILTGVILGLERAAGETAPILFTGAAFFLPRLPGSPFDATMALPYHLFVISTQVPEMPIQIQYGTALVLLVFVLTMNVIATIIRSRARAKRQW